MPKRSMTEPIGGCIPEGSRWAGGTIHGVKEPVKVTSTEPGLEGDYVVAQRWLVGSAAPTQGTGVLAFWSLLCFSLRSCRRTRNGSTTTEEITGTARKASST